MYIASSLLSAVYTTQSRTETIHSRQSYARWHFCQGESSGKTGNLSMIINPAFALKRYFSPGHIRLLPAILAASIMRFASSRFAVFLE